MGSNPAASIQGPRFSEPLSLPEVLQVVQNATQPFSVANTAGEPSHLASDRVETVVQMEAGENSCGGTDSGSTKAGKECSE